MTHSRNILEQILKNGEFEGLISEMEILLHEAKIKNPKIDLTAQQNRIKRLREFQLEYMEAIEEVRIVNKKNYELVAKQIHQTEILKNLQKKIDILEKSQNF